MKKTLLAVSFSLVFAIPGIAASALLPQFILKNKNQSKSFVKNTALSSDGYVDLSGHWTGYCNPAFPEEEMTIELAPDFSSIRIDGIEYPIDAISTSGSNGSNKQENTTSHMRWSSNGQELLSTITFNGKQGSLATGGLETVVANMQLLMNGEQLIQNAEASFFVDGVLLFTDKEQCVYTKKNTQ